MAKPKIEPKAAAYIAGMSYEDFKKEADLQTEANETAWWGLHSDREQRIKEHYAMAVEQVGKKAEVSAPALEKKK